ncbi:MAG: phosphoadenylyl-sulfate reductase [Acidobacteriota bacterium]
MQLSILDNEMAFAVTEDSPASELIEWALERFAGQKMVITTGFGMEGCALIDMCAAHKRPLDVVYLDTHFFFSETRQLIDRMKNRYPHLSFLNRGTRLTPQEQSRLYGPELWKHNPELCCRLRKVEPMKQALQGVDVWVTGLRRGQSASRAALQSVHWNWKYRLLQVNPLAAWRRRQVRQYVDSHDVPYNELHDRGYPSLGCTHCTRPVNGLSLYQYSREGRWAGQEKTECGLHVR